MERLTKRWGTISAVPVAFDLDFVFELDDRTCRGLQKVFDRLADYEDTGMDPEEINVLREFCESATGTTMRHIYEVVKAERQGRLVVASPTAKAKRVPAGRVSEEALQALEQMGAKVHSKEGEE